MAEEKAGSLREYVKQSDGSYAKQVFLAGSNVPDTQPVPTKSVGKKTAQPILLNAVTVAAGADYMNLVPFDFSQVTFQNLAYLTSSTGTATNNLALQSVEGSTYRNSLVGGIVSNSGSFRSLTTGISDMRGFNNVNVGFRNVDVQPITITLKAFQQF